MQLMLVFLIFKFCFIFLFLSETVIERGISKLKLIMTVKQMRLYPKIDYHPDPVTGDQIGRIFDIWKANRCISNPCFFISQLQFSNFSFSAK